MGNRNMSKVKFSPKLMEKNLAFRQGNFRFDFVGIPNVHFIVHNARRKDAVQHALKLFPGCMFEVHEFKRPAV